jgi:hypothetical protein
VLEVEVFVWRVRAGRRLAFGRLLTSDSEPSSRGERESLGKRFTCDEVENDLYMYMYINLCLRRRKKHVLLVM